MSIVRRTRDRFVAAGLALGLALAPTATAAHHATPEQVVQQLSDPATRSTFDITTVTRSAELPRLLIVRVGPGWSRVPSSERVTAAESWYRLWRDAVPSGVFAVVDAADHPLVNFDPAGHATLRVAQPPPTAAP